MTGGFRRLASGLAAETDLRIGASPRYLSPHRPELIEKTKRMDVEFVGWTSEEIEAIQSPALILIGDSDVVRPNMPYRRSGCSGAARLAMSPDFPPPNWRYCPARRT